MVVAGVGAGRVSMWHYVQDSRWNGEAARHMYTKPLLTALKKTFSTKRSWQVLEDNDPTGFKSGKGNAAKEEVNIKPFLIPKRSPDLSVCDYALWTEINRKMRAEERSWPKNKREARDDYMQRLRRTALRLPTAFITKSIGDMQRRCQRLYEAKGSLFEEGGRGR